MKSTTVGMISGQYELRLAEQMDDIHAAQRLRYEVFNLELQEGLEDAAATGRDADEFDEVCDHLIVHDHNTGATVGTYRMQTGVSAAAHLGYYSEREFDFTPLEPARAGILELGRACVAAEHRSQAVIGLLWKGIAQYAQGRDVRYLVGCSSLTSQDEAAGLAAYRALAPEHLAGPKWQTRPHAAWRCAPREAHAVAPPIPRLLRAYLALGAKICGEPAIDREFRTIDFLTWLDLQTLPVRLLNKFIA